MGRRYPDLHRRGEIFYFFWRDEQGKAARALAIGRQPLLVPYVASIGILSDIRMFRQPSGPSVPDTYISLLYTQCN